MFCFLCIFLWVKYEKSYDRFYPDYQNLYQVIYEYHGAGGSVQRVPTHAAALGPALQNDYPEIKNVARTCDFLEYTMGTKENHFIERVRFVDPSFLEMFPLRFIEGNPKNALSQPDSILLTESVAAKHFKRGEALGKEIRLRGDIDLIVMGVIEEMSKNSHFESLCIIPIAILGQMGKKLDRWGEQNYRTYIHLKDSSSAGQIGEKISNVYQAHNPDNTHSKVSIRPITDIHLHELNGGGLITYIYIFSLLAGFILIIAVINFMNLSTARSSLRAKEVGVRKVTGANRAQLALQFLGESILSALVAVLLAAVLVRLFLPGLNRLVEAQIPMHINAEMIMLLVGISVLTGILSGSYPALLLSSFQAIQVLKGAFHPGLGKLGLRRFLVIFQFSISVFLIIGMMVVGRQLKYMKNMDLGYDQENLICLRYTNEMHRNYEAIKSELLRNPEILGITRTNHTLDTVRSTTSTSTINWPGKNTDRDLGVIHVLSADQDFVDTFGIKMSEGRFFSLEFPSDPKESVVLNRTAIKAMELESPVGKSFSLWGWKLKIIGVMEDFHLYSLQREIQPVVMVMGRAGLSNVVIRIHSQNLTRTITSIKAKIKEVLPGYSMNHQFLDEKLENIYKAEQRMQAVTKYLTFLAIFLSCLGLLGLTAFTTQQRTKEIGIRRVLGASQSHIVWMLFQGTARWVLAANLVAWPVTYLVVQGWLKNYAYRTSIHIWIFILAAVVTLAFTFLTVGWQSLKVATANPVDSLRYE